MQGVRVALPVSCIPPESGSGRWLLATSSPGSVNDSEGGAGLGQAVAIGKTRQLPYFAALVCHASIGTWRGYSHGAGAVGPF